MARILMNSGQLGDCRTLLSRCVYRKGGSSENFVNYDGWIHGLLLISLCDISNSTKTCRSVVGNRSKCGFWLVNFVGRGPCWIITKFCNVTGSYKKFSNQKRLKVVSSNSFENQNLKCFRNVLCLSVFINFLYIFLLWHI